MAPMFMVPMRTANGGYADGAYETSIDSSGKKKVMAALAARRLKKN